MSDIDTADDGIFVHTGPGYTQSDRVFTPPDEEEDENEQFGSRSSLF